MPAGKRASFSSGSANFSIGEKSLGEKSGIGDDASTRGLAGSIANYKSVYMFWGLMYKWIFTCIKKFANLRY